MPFKMQYNNLNWQCFDFENKTFVVNNVFTIPVGSKTNQIMRIATLEDPLENMTEIDLSFIGIRSRFFYVPSNFDE